MSSSYSRRIIDTTLDELMTEFPAIALEGPKAVGKTATARQRVNTEYRLDDELDRERFVNAREPFIGMHPPILVDEWQHIPSVWNTIRRRVDDGAGAGTFLLAGSAAPAGADIHSGAGRIQRLRMRPLSLAERGLDAPVVSVSAAFDHRVGDVTGSTEIDFTDYAREMTASGFPGIRRFSAPRRAEAIRSYIDNVIDREFADQGLRVRRPDALRRWLRAYASATATETSYSSILDVATPGEGNKPAASTTIAYRDVLQSLWLLDEVGPWDPTGTSITRLSQTPKHYLADPALAASLLQLDQEALLDGPLEPDFGPKYGSIAGRLFESQIALDVQTYAAASSAHVSYLRTRNGTREIDFVLQRGRRVVAIEVKLAPTVTDHDVRHLHWMREHLGGRLAEAIIVTTGRDAYRRAADGIIVSPAALLGP